MPLLIYLAWYAGWGHEAEHHLTLHNVLTSPAYVMEGLASALDSLAGLSTIPVNSPGQNDWGGRSRSAPSLSSPSASGASRGYREPSGRSRAAATSYWALAALNFVPGREASASRYVYAGAVFVLLMAAELLRGWKFSPRALLVMGALAICAIGPNLAQMKDGSDWEKQQSVYTRADLAAMEIARDTIAPAFFLGSVDVAGTASLSLVEAEKYFAAVDRWGSPAYSTEELASAPAEGRHFADLVLSQALPISSVTRAGAPPTAGARCVVLPGGSGPERPDVELRPGLTKVVVAPGPPANLSLRRFAEGEYPVALGSPAGGTTTSLRIPRDKAPGYPWFLHVEAQQATRFCR